jgi:hypothetical protein
MSTRSLEFSGQICPATRRIVPPGKGHATAGPCPFHFKTPGSRRWAGVIGSASVFTLAALEARETTPVASDLCDPGLA